jgi:hypothetical protein
MSRLISAYFRHPILGVFGSALIAIAVISAAFVLMVPNSAGGFAVLASAAVTGIVLAVGVAAMVRDIRRPR